MALGSSLAAVSFPAEVITPSKAMAYDGVMPGTFKENSAVRVAGAGAGWEGGVGRAAVPSPEAGGSSMWLGRGLDLPRIGCLYS